MVRQPIPKYLDFYTRCWRMVSMGSRGDGNPIRYWSVLIFCVATNVTLISFMCMHVYTHAKDIGGIAEVVDFATLFTAGLFRFLHAFLHGRRYDELSAFVHAEFAHESVGAGRKLTMDRYVRKIKIVSYSYMTLTILWVLQIVMTRVVYRMLTQTSAKPFLVVGVDTPYDQSTPLGKAASYTIHFTCYTTSVLAYCFGDAYWFVVLMLTTAQFELISYSIRSLAADDDKLTDFLYVERVIISCLNHHQKLRRCVRMMEKLLNSIVLVDFLHAITSITFILFDMTIAIKQQSAEKVLNLVGYFLLSVAHMWVLDYFGHKLTVKEEDISTAIYEIPWYKYPKKIRKEIVVMMILASNPYKLTGGKLFSLSLEFFGKSIRTIFSYFTVLLQLREE